MDYKDKIKMLDLQKEKLALKLERIAQKEKTLKANLKKSERELEAKRKYKLGGLVYTAFANLGISDFEDDEILGALIKAFESNSKVQRLAYKRTGEDILLGNRQENIQSAHAQGFSGGEV